MDAIGRIITAGAGKDEWNSNEETGNYLLLQNIAHMYVCS